MLDETYTVGISSPSVIINLLFKISTTKDEYLIPTYLYSKKAFYGIAHSPLPPNLHRHRKSECQGWKLMPIKQVAYIVP